MNRKKLIKSIIAGACASIFAAIPAAASQGTVTADLLNIRTAPSTSSSVVGMLNWGENVTITYEPSSEWYEIYWNDGCYYVSSQFINGGGSSSSSASDSASYYEETSADTYYEETNTSGDYLGTFTLTAYCACSSCCSGGSGITASGTVPTPGRTVAMNGVPFGTKLLINGNVYTVEDRGTAYGTVDIYMTSHSDALNFGVQSADVYQVY